MKFLGKIMDLLFQITLVVVPTIVFYDYNPRYGIMYLAATLGTTRFFMMKREEE